MKKLTGNELRQMFIDYFVEQDHTFESPASLVPVEDPSLLWINSGVATLKKYFDGTMTPENPRIVNAQKSIRTNDIENVGKTARHHTLFEMLGNFSIGDYFKEEAIKYAWDFLTSEKWLAIDPDKLYVTVYPNDEEAKQIWMDEIGLTEDHIISEEGNFWDIGEGPSGPNTEIFFDRGEKYQDLEDDDPENYPGGENERYLEIWNLVFSQFNHKPDDTYEPLPNKNIDTGMGLERMLSIIQDAPTNYETDLFLPIINEVENISGVTYMDAKQEVQTSFKVIADHIRAVSFAIADGALPSNEGRGYVLRRLIRRSVMHGRKLGIRKTFLASLVPTIAEITSEFYPEVSKQVEFIEQIISKEEERFYETLQDGLIQLNGIIEKSKEKDQSQISGVDAFKLYDTFGFPVELTEEYAADEGLTIDYPGFETEMQAQKERARNARSDEQSMSVQSSLFNELEVDTEFLGYDNLESKGRLESILTDESFVESVNEGQVQLVFDQTPFYAEKGGQIGDKGTVRNLDGDIVAHIVDVKSAPAGQQLHIAEVVQQMDTGSEYYLTVDELRRQFIVRNHTATHLLHQALKDVLGDHANQAGSLVAPDHLRFDFTHFEPVTDDELIQIERIVNQKIWDSIVVNTVETSIDEAKKMGAMALFGEKYGSEVRVVSVGDYSIELCGGTHVRNTAEIGIFKIISESGVGAGSRRIIARTSQAAYKWLEDQLKVLDKSAGLVKAQTREQTPEKIDQLQGQIKELKQEQESLLQKMANQEAEGVFNNIQEINGYKVIIEEASVKDMDQLRQLSDKWKQESPSDILVLGLKQGDKANLLVAMNESAISNGLKSGDLIKAITPYVNGGGGGRPDLAQAGGKNPDGLNEALGQAEKWIANQ